MPDAVEPNRVMLLARRVGHGGMTRQMVESAIDFAERGKETRVLSVDGPGMRAHEPALAAAGVATRLVERLNRSAVEGALGEFRPDLVRISTGRFPPDLKLSMRVASLGYPVLETLHAMSMKPMPGVFRVASHHSGQMRRYRAIAMSQPMYDECVRRLPALRAWLRVVPYGMRLPDYSEIETADTPRPAARTILTTARLVEHHKDTTTLLRAFAQLMDRGGSAVRLRIAGDGPDRKALEALAVELGVRDRCDFLGWLDDPREEMCRADVFVLSTKSESFGRVNVEAASAGTPVVASDVLGCRASVDEGVNGLLVRPGDAGSLAGAIERVLSDGTLRARLGAAGPAFASRFAIARQTDAMIACWRDIVAPRRVPRPRRAHGAGPLRGSGW